jgi:hypothetical protein
MSQVEERVNKMRGVGELGFKDKVETEALNTT